MSVQTDVRSHAVLFFVLFCFFLFAWEASTVLMSRSISVSIGHKLTPRNLLAIEAFVLALYNPWSTQVAKREEGDLQYSASEAVASTWVVQLGKNNTSTRRTQDIVGRLRKLCVYM